MNEDASMTRSGRRYSITSIARLVEVDVDFDFQQGLEDAFEQDNDDCLTDDGCDSDEGSIDPSADARGVKRSHSDVDDESATSDADSLSELSALTGSSASEASSALRPSGKARRKALKKARFRARRKQNRREAKEAAAAEAVACLLADADAVEVDHSPQQYPVNRSGYEARRDASSPRVVETPAQLRAEGYHEEPWDGRTPKLLHARKTREVMVALIGQPGGSYQKSVDALLAIILDAEKSLKVNDKDRNHRRHSTPALHWGFSHGNGAKEPHDITVPQKNRKVFLPVVNNCHARRIARFGTCAYSAVYPLVHQEMKDTLHKLRSHEKFSSLHYPFPKSDFPAATINFGPQVTCFEHRDHLNVPHGMCAVTALGQFDPTQGGHLILHDLKVFIQFPPGALILLPSAVLRHANTPVQEGETRVSLTQYCAGSLYRFVNNGFRTDKTLEEEDPQAYLETMKNRKHRWREAMEKIPTVDTFLRRP